MASRVLNMSVMDKYCYKLKEFGFANYHKS